MNCLLNRKFALHDENFLIFCTTCGQGKEENMDIPVHVSVFCFWLFFIKVVFSGIEGKCSSRSNLTRFPTSVCMYSQRWKSLACDLSVQAGSGPVRDARPSLNRMERL